MTGEQVERFFELAEKLAKEMGGFSFEQGLQITRNILGPILSMLQKAESRELFAQQMASDIPDEWEDLFVNFVRFMPAFLSYGASALKKSVQGNLPAPNTGRTAVPADKQVAMVKYVLFLYGEKKVSLKTAKERAAAKFGWSIRTVNRYWSQRNRILESGPEIRFSDVLAAIQQKWAIDRKSGQALF